MLNSMGMIVSAWIFYALAVIAILYGWINSLYLISKGVRDTATIFWAVVNVFFLGAFGYLGYNLYRYMNM